MSVLVDSLKYGRLSTGSCHNPLSREHCEPGFLVAQSLSPNQKPSPSLEKPACNASWLTFRSFPGKTAKYESEVDLRFLNSLASCSVVARRCFSAVDFNLVPCNISHVKLNHDGISQSPSHRAAKVDRSSQDVFLERNRPEIERHGDNYALRRVCVSSDQRLTFVTLVTLDSHCPEHCHIACPQQHYPPIQDASPHQNIYPQTPQSAGHSTDHGRGSSTHDGGGLNDSNDPKRSRACEACRGLKVRCEPDPTNPDGPCKRCAKANRNCVVTAPSRKRQKKTDSRVAELEKKIDALTASLKATKSGSPSLGIQNENGMEDGMNIQAHHNPYQQVTNGGYGSPYVARPDVARMHSNEWSGYPKAPEFNMGTPGPPPMVMAGRGQKRKLMDGRDSLPDSRSSLRGTKRSVDTGPGVQQYAYGDSLLPQQKAPATHEYADVIDRGLITAGMAAKMFDCYVERMAPHMPAVIFPPGTTAAEVRKTKPTLFLAILSAASGMNYPDLQRTLTKEIMSVYAERIICNGEKTLEIIQALHVSTLWYWPPEHFEELQYYQLIHLAAVLAIDIGMGKKSSSSKSKNAGLWRDHSWQRTPYPDPETIEARRTWLGCYYLCCNASMGLRRPNLIRWTSFMADCLDVLEHSPEAAPSDKALCQWVRSQHIAEEIGTQFCMDDPVATVSIADSTVQYALKGFERDLEKWSSQVPPDVQSRESEHVPI